MSLADLFLTLKGGAGSGNFNHSGRPGKVGGSSKEYIITGADLGNVYHGSKIKVKKVDSEFLQSRDSGYYGTGFYVAKSPNYAKSYGRTISTYSIKPDAIVMVASLNAKDAPQSFVSDVKDHYFEKGKKRAEERGKLDLLREEVELIDKSPLSWKEAVNLYAIDSKVDIVKYSDGEIVVRNPDVLIFEK